MEAITLRDVAPADVQAVVDLLIELNRVEGKTHAPDARSLAAALFDQARAVKLSALVAQANERVVGVLFYYPGYDVLTTSDGYHLADFVVDADYRRQGVGLQLFTQLAQQNLARGGEWISLTVLSNNEAARGFYRKIGMIQVGVDFFAIGERGLGQLISYTS